MDCHLPGSSVHGISQARILEWVAIFFPRGSSRLKGSKLGPLHWQVDSLPESPGTPNMIHGLEQVISPVSDVHEGVSWTTLRVPLTLLR